MADSYETLRDCHIGFIAFEFFHVQQTILYEKKAYFISFCFVYKRHTFFVMWLANSL